MADLYVEWNGDFVVTPNGSAQFATGWDQSRERIVRRMLTNSAQQLPDGRYTLPDYIFDIGYGLGGGSLVDQNPTAAFLTGLEQKIRAGVTSDADVDPSVTPTVVIKRPAPNLFWILVSATLSDGTPGQVAVQIGG